jgi:hypothetical protein
VSRTYPAAGLVVIGVGNSDFSLNINFTGGKLVVFAGYPVGAILKDLLLPDGDDLLQAVDRFVAGQEGLLAVG